MTEYGQPFGEISCKGEELGWNWRKELVSRGVLLLFLEVEETKYV